MRLVRLASRNLDARAIRRSAVALALSFGFPILPVARIKEKPLMNVKRISPVLLVNAIEPLLPFWIDRLGFTKTIEVPGENHLAFVAFQRDSAEVMYQTYASVEKDAPPSMAAAARKRSHLSVH